VIQALGITSSGYRHANSTSKAVGTVETPFILRIRNYSTTAALSTRSQMQQIADLVDYPSDEVGGRKWDGIAIYDKCNADGLTSL
jgi:hypothetical protein